MLSSPRLSVFSCHWHGDYLSFWLNFVSVMPCNVNIGHDHTSCAQRLQYPQDYFIIVPPHHISLYAVAFSPAVSPACFLKPSVVPQPVRASLGMRHRGMQASSETTGVDGVWQPCQRPCHKSVIITVCDLPRSKPSRETTRITS